MRIKPDAAWTYLMKTVKNRKIGKKQRKNDQVNRAKLNGIFSSFSAGKKIFL